VEAVLAAPGVSASLDEEEVAASLSSVRRDTATRTFYRAVRKLPAGHALVVEPEAGGTGRLRVRLERYWRPEEIPAAWPAADNAYTEQFLDLYGKAVRDRLRGGPVGVHLSGGLDSSSVAVLAAQAPRRQGRPVPPAFSWLLEFALSLPPDQFRRPAHNRWLMRHGLRRVLPPAVCWNRSNDDPARVEPVVEAIAVALPAARRRARPT